MAQTTTTRDLSWTRPREACGLFLRGCTLRTACPTALVVGTVLSALHQGGVLVGGAATVGTWIRIAVNYLVPFLVASVGYLSARRTRTAPDSPVGKPHHGTHRQLGAPS
jgi:hypothetical protein